MSENTNLRSTPIQLARAVGVREEDVQKVFDNWSSPSNVRLAGLTPWMREAQVSEVANDRSRRPGPGGLAVTPDVVWGLHSGTYVVELKFAAKYEPLALAEVIYQVEAIRAEGKSIGPIHPVMLTQSNFWLRATLGFLHREGLRKGAIQHVEVDCLEAEGERLFWFDVPQAPWKEGIPPNWVKAAATKVAAGAPSHWYHVAETETWWGASVALPERPEYYPETFTWIATARVKAPKANFEDVVVWIGSQAEKAYDEKFFLCQLDKDD